MRWLRRRRTPPARPITSWTVLYSGYMHGLWVTGEISTPRPTEITFRNLNVEKENDIMRTTQEAVAAGLRQAGFDVHTRTYVYGCA